MRIGPSDRRQATWLGASATLNLLVGLPLAVGVVGDGPVLRLVAAVLLTAALIEAILVLRWWRQGQAIA